MDPRFIYALAQVFGGFAATQSIWPVFEHVALHAINAGTIHAYVGSLIGGFKFRLMKDGCPAFVQKGNLKIELIPDETPEHYAYAVQQFEAWESLLGSFMKRDDLFDYIPGSTQMSDDLHVAMFRCTNSGQHVQIVWRKKQIFEGIFPE